VCARGESLPLADGSIDGVLCWLALPYMHIPRALAEIHRVLVPGGWFTAALHRPRFTWQEFCGSFPRPKQSLFRTLVFVNGMVLHCSGSVISVFGISESCQTESGMRMALQRAGFGDLSFRHEGGRFLVDARRDDKPR
jgi:ubiquinone/menaquinone biosynthesis C-methylase UbiE